MNAPAQRTLQFLPLLVGAAGAVLSLVVATIVGLEEERRFHAEFERRGELRERIARESLARQENSVSALAMLFEGSEHVSPAEFAGAAGELLKRHPEARAFQWIQVVAGSGRAAHEARRSAELGMPYRLRERDPEGRLVPAAARDVHWPITYTAPLETNEAALGYDLFVGPTTESLARTARTRAPCASRAFTLVQDPGAGLHVSLQRAVYKDEDLVGFVQGLFKVEALMLALWEASDKGRVELVLQDLSDVPGQPEIWRSPTSAGEDPGVMIERAHRVDPLQFGERTWRLHSAPTQAALAARPHWVPYLVFSGGLLVTVLTCSLIVGFSRRARWVEQQVEERTLELKLAREMLEADMRRREAAEAGRIEAERALAQRQRLDSLAVLAGGIAHDLNNVLAPIILAVDVVRGEVQDPRHASLLDSARESAVRGAGLVRQVLAFSRGIEGTHKPIDLAALVASVKKVFAESIPPGIAFEVEVPAAAPWVLGDRDHLHRALLNLLVNARDATAAGGRIRLAVSTRPGDPPHGKAVLVVEDTGTGIPPEVRARMFEPFFSTKRPGSGNGLGLAMVDAVVRSHRGTIEVDSVAGRGTTFRLVLPAAAPGTAGPGTAPPFPARGGEGRRLLVVDDEEPLLLAARHALAQAGYEVATARGGKEALALMSGPGKVPVDLVVTDLSMPEGGGMELVAALRASGWRGPVLVTSGFTEGTLPEGGGRVARLDKPFTSRELQQAVAALLDVGPAPSRP